MAMRSSWTRLYVIAASFLPLVGVTSSPRILGFASPRSLKLWRNWYVSFLFFHFYWLPSVIICSFICWQHGLFFLPVGLHHLDLRCLPVCTPSTLCWIVGSASWHALVSCPSTYACLPLATCYLLDKMTEPMQVSSAYNCKAFHLMF